MKNLSDISRSEAGSLSVDWGELSPLRLHARLLAEEVYAGRHRSVRRGTGVEFDAYRPYVPGDDLRFLDRHSLLRHDRLLVRQFQTDTERSLSLCLDASASMAFRGAQAPASKLAYAGLLAAALARVAVSGQDPVSLSWLGGNELRVLGAQSGKLAFERIVVALESVTAAGDLHNAEEQLRRCWQGVARRSKRGSVVVFFSDLLDLPPDTARALAALATGHRAVVVVQVIDPEERDLSYRGMLRFRSIEGDKRVETDADAVRAQYRQRLHEHVAGWRRTLEREGGRLVESCSDEQPVRIVREIVQAIAGARR